MQMRTSWPEYGNKFYNNGNAGGWSWCVNGNPTCDGRNVLANCVGYACGRFNEIIGEMRYPELCCNANRFADRARELGLQVVGYPTLGGIMVWDNGGAGHVAVVERIDSASRVYTSESDWGGQPFYNAFRDNSNGRWGLSSNFTFIGCIINPAVGDVHWVDPTPTKSIDEVAREVINGDWGNGEERKQRLTDAGYNYDEVQARVNEILAGEQGNLTIGTRVRATGEGNASCEGDGNVAYVGNEGTITDIREGQHFPYLISDDEGALGWYKAEDLEII